MLYLIYVLAIIAIALFFIFSIPGVTKKMIEELDRPIIPRLIASVVVIGLTVLATLFFGVEGTYSYDTVLGIGLLNSAVILLSYNILMVKGDLKEFNSVLKDKYHSEESERQQQIQALEEKSKAIEDKERKLKDENEALKNEKEMLESLQKKLTVKENEFRQLESLEEKLKRDRGELQSSIRIGVQAELQNITLEYERRATREKVELQEKYNAKIVAFVSSATQKMHERIHSDKKDLLDDIFSFDGETSDDFFEMKQLKESLTHEKEEIEKSRLLVEMEQKVSQANEHVVNAKSSALDIKSENVDLKSELKLLANEFTMGLTKEQLTRENAVDTVLHKLELEQERRKADYQKIGSQLQVMDAQTKAGLIELKSSLTIALKDLQLSTANSLREVRENVGDMKLQFGQEILRLDGQQGQILTELEKYYAKNQQFVNQCQGIALEAKSQNLDGQNILNKVNTLYGQYKTDARGIEQRLRTSMDQVSVKESQLANSVGESMLKLKSISDQQFSTMRDMALEKKDINLLWKEKNEEHDRNIQEVRHQKQDLDMNRKLFNQEQSSFDKHKSSVMENARLTHRNYMQEQEYKMAMFKAENSGGWLSRWAKNIENLQSK